MRHWKALLAMVLALFLLPEVAGAHVKWFTDFSFTDPPRTLGEVLTPLFFGLTALSVVTLAALVFVESRIRHMDWYKNAVNWFMERRDYSTLVMRIGMGLTLMLSWQADTLLSPDLNVADQPAIGWLQFFIAGLLLFPRTTPIAGLGVIGLYGLSVVQFGAFYMLDYFAFVGVGVFLLLSTVQNIRIRALRIPALYFSVGFSLCWLALEKLIYAEWGLYLLEQNPQLALGLNIEFFLISAAFVEFALGYLLIIGLLERPLALVITAVFFTTTLVFGKVEVIGHTIIHAALIVFLLMGPGTVYKPPVETHRRLPMRMAFASVNFVVLLAVLIIPYSALSQAQYREEIAEEARIERFIVDAASAGVFFPATP